MIDVPNEFGSMVFDDRAMKRLLEPESYESLRRTIAEGRSLNITLAAEVAEVMKNWAIERGATHFTHWFQPMNGVTAEKHDSFVMPDGNGGAIYAFSGTELIKGESDASSFPSGGLRSTFEARGYTAWDPTSYAFIKDETLCIPTAFCSFGGEALDKKTPLMRSMETLNRETLRVLRLFGDNETIRVMPAVGAEQEYFLIDKKLFDRRSDLIFTGRTLIGAKPPKGQELDDHYYGAIKPRVKDFMRELNDELWKLGVCAKTEHNEAAPSQHELAPIFTTANFAADQNQLTMELMKRTALKHGFVCVLHEKPFLGVNGSGKHNNWSLITDKGYNLLNPGSSPSENIKFLIMLCAIIKGVDDYQDILRASVEGAGNDCRLGSNEAPPAIISIFLGDELTYLLDEIANGNTPSPRAEAPLLRIGVHVLPKLPRDITDRNRTSPFAFTGNKFEFRMPGASMSIAEPNFVLNTIVAESLSLFADRIEKDLADDIPFNNIINSIISETVKNHRRIIFNGNNYSQKWVEEARTRGLLNLPTSIDAIPCFEKRKNIDLFIKHKVFTETEVHSRCEILLGAYCKRIHIEVLTMIDIVSRELLPAAFTYLKEISTTAQNMKSLGLLNEDSIEYIETKKISYLAAAVKIKTEELKKTLDNIEKTKSSAEISLYVKDKVLFAMKELREAADALENDLPKKYIPYPTYEELLFSE